MTENDKRYDLICEDSLEGIFSGIYDAYRMRKKHENIHLQTEPKAEYTLFTENISVPVNAEHAVKVQRTLERIMGEKEFFYLCLAMAAPETDKADAVYHTVVDCITGGSGSAVMQHLTDPYVNRTFKLGRRAEREIQHLQGFARFSLLDDVMLCRITPQNDILLYLMPHFADRFPQEDFIIADTGRTKYGVHPKGKQWYIVKDEFCHVFGEDKDETAMAFWERAEGAEQDYRRLFQLFVETIAIRERTNLKLQRQMLPLRFRGNMTEFGVVLNSDSE